MTPQATSEQGPSAPRKLAAISAAAVVLGAFAVVAIRQLSGGVVHVDLFPSDTLFVIDIIERIAAGQVPHVDFAMHVGSLPYVLAALSGAPTPAEGFLVAQTAFTATCLLIGLWVWHRRLDNLSGPLLLIFILVLGQTLAMPTNSELSLGLFYNRWSWALALLFVCQTLLPAKDKTAPWPDGALAGLIAFMLLTTKITFFVGLLPAALFCTVYRGQWREIGAGLVVFALLALAVFAVAPSFWAGYAENVGWVASNPLRPNAGTELASLVGGASFLGFTAVFAVFLVAVFRTAGGVETLWLAVAAAGFYFIQYQNFLNAPFWVLFLALYSLRQAGAAREDRPLRTIWRILAVAFVLISAALLGPMTHGLGGEGATSEGVAYLPYPPEGRNPTGLVVAEPLLRPIETKTVSIAEAMSPWAGDAECVISAGWAGVSLELANVVAELPGPAFIADSISPYWFLAGVEPLADVAVWNYGSLRGLENADFVVVPVCAQKPSYKRVILVEMERQGVTLEPYSESEWATIYRRIEVPG